MILTLKELADYLKLNDRTIIRMLKNGQIKGTKLGGQWRFNGSEIDQLFFPNKEEGSDDVPLSELTHSQFGIQLSRLINADRIILDMKATTAEEAINELVNPQVFNKLVLNVNELRAKCMEREKMLSTGVGQGIAVPHPRDPVPTLRASGCIVFGRSEKGIEFNSVDGKPVKLFFLICSQTADLHLYLMGKIATMLRDKNFVSLCNSCKEPDELIRAMMAFERSAFLKSDKSED